MRAAWFRGRGARRTDERRGVAPPAVRELRDVAGSLWHAARNVTPQGFVMAAHSAGRLRQGLSGERRSRTTFLSGESGTVTGLGWASRARWPTPRWAPPPR